MSFRDEMKAFFDQNKMANPNANQVRSDNGLLYTAEYLHILELLGEVTQDDEDMYDDLVMSCYIERGLTSREPLARNNRDQDSPDNMIGIASASEYHAMLMLMYGRDHMFNYNTPNPGTFTWNSWFGRQPGLIGFLELRAEGRTSWWRKLSLCVGAVLTMRQPLGETSDRLLNELIMRTVPQDDVTLKICRWFWDRHIKKRYGGINGVVKIYFANSPFAQYWT